MVTTFFKKLFSFVFYMYTNSVNFTVEMLSSLADLYTETWTPRVVSSLIFFSFFDLLWSVVSFRAALASSCALKVNQKYVIIDSSHSTFYFSEYTYLFF